MELVARATLDEAELLLAELNPGGRAYGPADTVAGLGCAKGNLLRNALATVVMPVLQGGLAPPRPAGLM